MPIYCYGHKHQSSTYGFFFWRSDYVSAIVQSKIKHFSAILFVSNRKQVLDYYSKLGFWCDYEYAMVEGIDKLYDERVRNKRPTRET